MPQVPYKGIVDPFEEFDDGLIPSDEYEKFKAVHDRTLALYVTTLKTVANLHEELQNLYNDGEFSFTKAVRKDQIKGKLGQLEYDVKLLKGLLGVD